MTHSRALGRALVCLLPGLLIGVSHVAAAPTPPEAGAKTVRIVSARLERPVIGLDERCELTLQLEGEIHNPYDPDEITVETIFRPPRGHAVAVEGFYYQPFDRVVDGRGGETLQPSGVPVWKVRFTPRHLGRWSYECRLKTARGTQSFPGEAFDVVPSTRPGFVQFDRQRGVFRFDNGKPFVPIGENLAWGPSMQPLRAYDEWFQDLVRQRANYIRVWMAPWSFRLETKETGVGRYDQARAWQLDYLLDQSQRLGLYWQLCLLDHGSFSQSQDPAWDHNPYNAQLGGVCRLPNEFLTDPRARTAFRHLLRYLINRWGYHPQLVSWELFNEPDLSELRLEDLPAWVSEMSQMIRVADVNQRPITISFQHAAPAPIWRLPAIDVIQVHRYDERDFAGLFCGSLIPDLQGKFQKPVMIGEFGWINEFVRQLDQTGIHLHDGLWSSMMGGATGSALSWFWDTYVHPNALQRHFRPLAKFWGGEPMAKPLARLDVSFSDPELIGCGVGTAQRGYLWVKNRRHNLDQYLAYRCEAAKQRLRAARGEPAQPVSYAPPSVHGATAIWQGLASGMRYRIQWWDPYRGRIMESTVGTVRQGRLTVAIPDLTFDVAVKLIRMHWWERD